MGQLISIMHSYCEARVLEYGVFLESQVSWLTGAQSMGPVMLRCPPRCLIIVIQQHHAGAHCQEQPITSAVQALDTFPNTSTPFYLYTFIMFTGE